MTINCNAKPAPAVTIVIIILCEKRDHLWTMIVFNQWSSKQSCVAGATDISCGCEFCDLNYFFMKVVFKQKKSDILEETYTRVLYQA